MHHGCWGAKIKARGIYRDAVRSSHGHFVKTSGLRWLLRIPTKPPGYTEVMPPVVLI